MGATILTTINTVILTNTIYWAIAALRLPPILGQQHYKVYTFDPSSSDFIQHLSDTFEAVAFLGSISVALFSWAFIPSRGSVQFARIWSIFWLLVSWGLMGGLFLGAQFQLGVTTQALLVRHSE